MRYLRYVILASLAAGGALTAAWSSSRPRSPANQEPSAQAGPQEKPQKDRQDELEEFEPSEKVPADSAISFPVDI